MPSEFHCANCGAAQQPKLKSTKLVVCDYCDSTSFLEDEAVRLAGQKGVMHERPCLLRLGQPFDYRGHAYTPVGHARFEYGPDGASLGWWDEFWATDGADGVWISVDEGDIAIERAIEMDQKIIPAAHHLKVGQKVQLGGETYLVTEFAKATCLAIRGELPEILQAGDQFHYAHLRQGGAKLLTLEYSSGDVAVTDGEWLDPFEIQS